MVAPSRPRSKSPVNHRHRRDQHPLSSYLHQSNGQPKVHPHNHNSHNAAPPQNQHYHPSHHGHSKKQYVQEPFTIEPCERSRSLDDTKNKFNGRRQLLVESTQRWNAWKNKAKLLAAVILTKHKSSTATSKTTTMASTSNSPTSTSSSSSPGSSPPSSYRHGSPLRKVHSSRSPHPPSPPLARSARLSTTATKGVSHKNNSKPRTNLSMRDVVEPTTRSATTPASPKRKTTLSKATAEHHPKQQSPTKNSLNHTHSKYPTRSVTRRRRTTGPSKLTENNHDGELRKDPKDIGTRNVAVEPIRPKSNPRGVVGGKQQHGGGGVPHQYHDGHNQHHHRRQQQQQQHRRHYSDDHDLRRPQQRQPLQRHSSLPTPPKTPLASRSVLPSKKYLDEATTPKVTNVRLDVLARHELQQRMMMQKNSSTDQRHFHHASKKNRLKNYQPPPTSNVVVVPAGVVGMEHGTTTHADDGCSSLTSPPPTNTNANTTTSTPLWFPCAPPLVDAL